MANVGEVIELGVTDDEVACEELMRTLAHDALEERLNEVIGPKTGETLDPSSRSTPAHAQIMQTDHCTLSVRPEAKIVRPEFKFQPSDESRELSGRFTSRRQKALAVPDDQAQRIRPGRLGGAVMGSGRDPLLELSELGASAEDKADAPRTSSEFADLPAFMHLARLEEAIGNGSELPELPSFAPGRRAPMTGSTSAVATAAGYSGGTSRVMLNAQPGRTQKDSNRSTGKATPRVLVASGAWGLQPSAPPGSRRPAGNAAALGFSKSALRGTGVAKKGSGAHATALWIGTEVARLREEAAQPAGLGTSHAAAFLVNNGPEQLDSLSAQLTWTKPAL